MVVTFIAHTTTVPSGGLMAMFEFAGGLSRLGHEVHLVHRWHPFVSEKVHSVEDVSWFRFDDRINHHFVETVESFPSADFVFWAGTSRLPARCGLPVMLVQGDLTGTDKLRKRLSAPVPKVCVARWIVEYGLEFGVPEEQLVHVPYGIRHETYRLTSPIEGRPMQVAMLYHRHPKKGVQYGMEALGKVKNRLPALEVVMFGTKDPEQSLPPWIRYVRNPTRDKLVHDVYNTSRVFVQPSLREGFGFTPVEAMACGCALVSTANGGSDDYAIDGVTALVTQPRDSDAMAQRVEQLLLDEELRVRLTRRGTEYVRMFDWDASAKRLESFLRQYDSAPLRFQQRTPLETSG